MTDRSELNAWLYDRAARAKVMRSAALVALTNHLVGGFVPVEDALGILLDEIDPRRRAPVAAITRAVAGDAPSVAAWLLENLDQARETKLVFAGIAFVLGEASPYSIDLALSSHRTSHGEDWASGVVARSPTEVALPGLDAIRGSMRSRSVSARETADYALPLAYSALIARDAIASLGVSKQHSAVVIYADGDEVDVPIGLA